METGISTTNLIVWFEATKDRVHDLFIDGNTLTFTQQIVPHKERKKITVHPFFVIYKAGREPTPYW
jgi:hypothetical protein